MKFEMTWRSLAWIQRFLRNDILHLLQRFSMYIFLVRILLLGMLFSASAHAQSNSQSSLPTPLVTLQRTDPECDLRPPPQRLKDNTVELNLELSADVGSIRLCIDHYDVAAEPRAVKKTGRGASGCFDVDRVAGTVGTWSHSATVPWLGDLMRVYVAVDNGRWRQAWELSSTTRWPYQTPAPYLVALSSQDLEAHDAYDARPPTLNIGIGCVFEQTCAPKDVVCHLQDLVERFVEDGYHAGAPQLWGFHQVSETVPLLLPVDNNLTVAGSLSDVGTLGLDVVGGLTTSTAAAASCPLVFNYTAGGNTTWHELGHTLFGLSGESDSHTCRFPTLGRSDFGPFRYVDNITDDIADCQLPSGIGCGAATHVDSTWTSLDHVTAGCPTSGVTYHRSCGDGSKPCVMRSNAGWGYACHGNVWRKMALRVHESTGQMVDPSIDTSVPEERRRAMSKLTTLAGVRADTIELAPLRPAQHRIHVSFQERDERPLAVLTVQPSFPGRTPWCDGTNSSGYFVVMTAEGSLITGPLFSSITIDESDASSAQLTWGGYATLLGPSVSIAAMLFVLETPDGVMRFPFVPAVGGTIKPRSWPREIIIPQPGALADPLDRVTRRQLLTHFAEPLPPVFSVRLNNRVHHAPLRPLGD